MTEQPTNWVQRAGRAKLEAKAQAVIDAASDVYWDWATMEVAASYTIVAVALREVINQCQNGQGVISAAELYMLADYLDQPTSRSN